MKTKEDKDIRKEVKSYIQYILWAVSAGRCEFQGCNDPLYYHGVTKESGNYAEKAHIRAVSPGGSRYSEQFSEEEKNCIENLMLLCKSCHTLIDNNPELYPVEHLYEMKKCHEDRVKELTAINDIQKTTMVSYFAAIGDKSPVATDKQFRHAVLRNKCIPDIQNAYELSSKNSMFYDGTTDYYAFETESLRIKLLELKPIIEKSDHVSLFALAPQPLLIKLGEELSDIKNITVFQCHRRDEYKWTWSNQVENVDFLVSQHNSTLASKTVALIIALSAEILIDRITRLFENELPIYIITLADPNRNFVTNKNIADKFIVSYRNTIEKIKNTHPECELLALFPAMPNSLAVRIGLDFMPKTDIPMEIYDEFNGTFLKKMRIP